MKTQLCHWQFNFILWVAHFITKLKVKRRGHCFSLFEPALLNSFQHSDQPENKKIKMNDAGQFHK